MGRATITENLGEGLYKIRLIRNQDAINAELLALPDTQKAAGMAYQAANEVVRHLIAGVSDARAGLDAILLQWKMALISAAQEDPPIIPPIVPGNLPEEEQANLLFEAINAHRTTAATRSAALNSAAESLLQALARTGNTSDIGSTANQRVTAAGYALDLDVGAAQVAAFGSLTAADAVEAMLRNSGHRAAIQDDAYTDAGAAYRYVAGNPYTYLWCAVLAAPGASGAGDIEWPEDNAAADAAEDSDQSLKKIEVPRLDDFSPKKLGEATAVYAAAVNALREAERQAARLALEWSELEKRRLFLLAALEEQDAPIHAWCCLFIDDIPLGATVPTAEVPGWYQPQGVASQTIMGIRNDPGGTVHDRTVNYVERPINIIPAGSVSGQVSQADFMSPEAVFIACALEPGWLMWEPLWRYGQITEINPNGTCTVMMWAATQVRTLAGAGESQLVPTRLLLDPTLETTIRNVPIASRCQFTAGIEPFRLLDEVLISFTGQDRAKPVIIGFRREPMPCPSGRISWGQVI